MNADNVPDAKEPARDKNILVRVSEAEKQGIEAKAKQAGYKSVSAYLRDVGQGVEIIERLPPALRRNLIGIGTNLNQIARLANVGKPFHSHEAQLKQALAIIMGHLG